MAYILPHQRSVVGVREKVRAEFPDEDGVIREHTFSFVIDHDDGSRTAIDVKPHHRGGQSAERRFGRIQGYNPGFADRYVVRTGEHITRDRAADARLMHRALRTRNERDMQAVMSVARTLKGAVPIETLLAATRNDSCGFIAVVCLIAEGVLEHLEPGRISHSSSVCLRDAHGQIPH